MSSRHSFRDIHFYNATGQYLGGCYQGGSITDANLDWILRNVLLVVEDHFTIRHRASGQVLSPSNYPAALGDYDISSEGRVTISDEPWLAPAASFSTSARDEAFGTSVVLANMRGAGEPVFETDFPPGTDRLATLRSEPYGKERLEKELQLRLESKTNAGIGPRDEG